ncbi:MAG: thermitase [Desulforhopalus sp.]|jgi:thermitase
MLYLAAVILKYIGERMKTLKLPVILWICIIFNVSSTWATDLSVHLIGDKLTLESYDEPLIKILNKLSDQGVRVRIDPQINPRVTARFYNRPIGPAMKSLLKSLDYALIWQESTDSASRELQLREIRIFHRGQEEQIRNLTSNVNLKVVKNANGTYHVQDILLLQLTQSITEETFQALLDQLGATVIDAHLPLGIVKLRLPAGTDIHTVAATISNYTGIQRAEPDFAYPVNGSRQIVGSESLNLSLTDNQSSVGNTVVAVLDSGLKADYNNSPFVLGTYDAVSPNSEGGDALGHGTQMTLIAAGVVDPKGIASVENESNPVVSIRAIDDNGFTSNYTLLNGIDYAIEMGARVISLSWGSETPSALLESATDYAAANGLILVAAAGNEPTGSPVYPAAYEKVIGVGALTPTGEPWVQSNYGDFVTLQAPGMAELPVGFQGDPGLYVGTSIATAYTAHSIAAILDEMPEADLSIILQKLKSDNQIQ